MKKVTRSSSEIRQIIEEEISKNKALGFIKNNQLFMNVDTNTLLYSPMNFLYFIVGILSIPFIFNINAVFTKDDLLVIFIPMTLAFILLLIQVFCFHYLIYDFVNSEFYTSSYLFNYFHLSLIDSNFIKSQKIKKLILETKYVSAGKRAILCDKILVLLNTDVEEELTEIMPSIRYHDISMERCILFSKCFNVDFAVRGEVKEIERIKKSNELGKKFLPYFFILFAIIIIYIIYEIYN